MTLKKYAPVATMLALAIVAAPLSAATDASRKAFQAEEAKLRKVIDKTLDAYIFIGGGSGAVISPDGYIITNNHVAKRSRNWTVRNAKGKRFRAVIVGLVPTTDLALLKIKGAKNMPFLPLGDSDKLEPGDPVVAVGNPFGLGNMDHTPTVTLGVVSAIGINRPHAADTVVTDTPINPGNSGGPLVNMDGELIGVNGQVSTRFGIRANTGCGYAISSNQVKRYLKVLKAAKGEIVMPGTFRGIRLDIDRHAAAKITNISKGSQAEKAGLKIDDVIVAIGDWPIVTVFELFAVAARFPVGHTVPLTVDRGEKQLTIDIKLVAPDRAAMGIIFDQKNPKSLKVKAVIPGGPADKAGIRPGDIITRIGRVRLRDRLVFKQIVQRGHPGQSAPVVVRRDGQNIPMRVRLASLTELRKLYRKSVQKRKPKPKPATEPATKPAN